MTDKLESLKNILKNLLEERLSYLEKRNLDQMKDLKFEKEAFKNQELLVQKLCSIKIELKKPPSSKNNKSNKIKTTANKSLDKTPIKKEIKVKRSVTPDISTRNIRTKKIKLQKEKGKTPLTKNKSENKLIRKNPKPNNKNNNNIINPSLTNESKNNKKIPENKKIGKRALTADNKLKNKNKKPNKTNKNTENNLKSIDIKIEPKTIKDKKEEKIETQKNEKIINEKEEPEKTNQLSNFVEQKNDLGEVSTKQGQKNGIISEKKVIGIKFNSTDQTVNYLLSCVTTDIFLIAEKKL